MSVTSGWHEYGYCSPITLLTGNNPLTITIPPITLLHLQQPTSYSYHTSYNYYSPTKLTLLHVQRPNPYNYYLRSPTTIGLLLLQKPTYDRLQLYLFSTLNNLPPTTTILLQLSPSYNYYPSCTYHAGDTGIGAHKFDPPRILNKHL